jgi:hypothetical protein
MENIHDPLKDYFAFQLAEGEAARRPTEPRRLSFDQVYPRNFGFYTAPFARFIVPLELVQAGDVQVVVYSRVGVHPMKPVSIDNLVNFPSVTSIVADQIVRARRLLPHIRELFVLNHLGTVDQETLVNLPGLESLSLGPGFGTQVVALEDTETYDWEADRLDLTVLVGMPHLRNLRFHALAVQSLEPLQHLHQLEFLRIEGFPRLARGDLLAGLTQLRGLGVEYMKGLRHLKGLINLEKVELYDLSLSSLKAFKGWKKVRYLLLTGRGVRSLEGIEELSSLEELFLGRTSISDLAPLAHVDSLRSLTLVLPDRVSDFSPLGRLKNLRELTINMGSETSAGHLVNASFVGSLENLERLEITGTVIDDQSQEQILNLPKLQRVTLLVKSSAQAVHLTHLKPGCEAEFIPVVPEPDLAFQVGPLVVRKIDNFKDTFWSIFQDLSDVLGVEDNFTASKRIQRAIQKQDAKLLARLVFDPDADFVSIQASTEEDIRAAAAIIADSIKLRSIK